MRQLSIALLTALVLPTLVLALGADHPKGPVAPQPSWPEGMENLVNRKDRIHGYWVNSEDIFFYSGNTQTLNDFLAQYAKLKDTKLVVVLHPGPKEATSPWSDKSAQHPRTDWMLYVAPKSWVIHHPTKKIKMTDPTTISQVDIWLGGNIRLADLQVPKNVRVESGGEIEDFIQKYQQ
jgi:hypothetical protein